MKFLKNKTYSNASPEDVQRFICMFVVGDEHLKIYTRTHAASRSPKKLGRMVSLSCTLV